MSMAQSFQPQRAAQASSPQHFIPPTARELRAQAVHRLQIGVLGLASMLLLVGLANIIMDRARMSDGEIASGAPQSIASKGGQSDPLADIGVVPAAEPTAAAAKRPRP